MFHGIILDSGGKILQVVCWFICLFVGIYVHRITKEVAKSLTVNFHFLRTCCKICVTFTFEHMLVKNTGSCKERVQCPVVFFLTMERNML